MFTGPINQADPVNWSHPLNQGKAGWWLTLPHLSGGPSIPELITRRDGPLTGSWATAGGANGMPLVIYTGASVSSSLPALSFSAPPITILQWVKPIGTYGTGYPATIGEASARGTILTGGSASGYLRYQWEGTADEYNGSSGITLTIGAWQLVALVVISTSATLYQVYQGVLKSWTNTKTHNAYTMGAFTIGGDRAIYDHYQTLHCDDVAIYTRALGAAEIMAAYDDRMAGYAGTLNRFHLPLGALASAPAGGPFPWYLDQSAMSGGLQTMGL